VKLFRIIVLVLLSILLPVRGAMAATMLCPDGSGAGTSTATVATGHMGHDMHADAQTHAAHGDHGAHHHASEQAPDANDASSADHPPTCNLCASGCCIASIVGTVPSLGEPRIASSIVFPALTSPVPAFQSDGQERPPRTI
jgi:hypothetical protein